MSLASTRAHRGCSEGRSIPGVLAIRPGQLAATSFPSPAAHLLIAFRATGG